MEEWGDAVRLIAFAIAVFYLASSASAFLDAPAEKLTLPELVKEFKSIEAVQAKTVDLDRGVVIWERDRQLRGMTEAVPVKHLLRLKGEVPLALRSLKPGAPAVVFSQDGWKRGLVLTDACWYVVSFEPEHECWRIAYTDKWYDFNVAFAGSPAELSAAIRDLLAGKDVRVMCRVKPKEPAVQTVEYSMKQARQKKVVNAATHPTSGN